MSTTSTPTTRRIMKWRVADIAVASVIGVASALIYWGAAIVTYAPWDVLEAVVPGLAGILNGLWLFAGPLAAVIVRKPGAALYAELVAAVLESLMGNMWGGVQTIIMGLVQGAFAELGFLIFAYAMWNRLSMMLAGALSGAACWGYSFFTNLQAVSLTGSYGIIYFVTTIISGALIAGLAMWYLFIAIAKTGAIDRFASGREIRNRH